MPPARSRHLFVLAFLLAMSALTAAVYLEKVTLLQPCSLCFVQRGFLVSVAMLSALAWWHRPGLYGTRAYAAGALLLAMLGAGSATRQLWLQVHAPIAERVCRSNLLPPDKSQALLETMKVFVLGTPDCAIVNWTLLDMSLPEWSLLTFAGLGVITSIQLFQR